MVTLLIALGILGFVAPAVGAGTSMMLRSGVRTRAEVASMEDLQISSDWLLRDAARASWVDIGPGGSSATFTWWDPYAGFINVSATYALSGGVLRRTSGASTITVGRNVTAVTFTHVTDCTLRLDATSAATGAARPFTGSMTIYMRSCPPL